MNNNGRRIKLVPTNVSPTALNLSNQGILSITIPEIFPICNTLEFLSLNNNCFRDVNFISLLPNLYYLDLSENYVIDNYLVLNQKNTFGYLSLSIELYHEKKLLVLKNLCVGVMYVQIKEKNILKQFVLNNPNIILLNDQFIYFREFIKPSTTTNSFKNKLTNKLTENSNKDEDTEISNQKLKDLIHFFSIYREKHLKFLRNEKINLYKFDSQRYTNDIRDAEKEKIEMLYKVYSIIEKYKKNKKLRRIQKKPVKDKNKDNHKTLEIFGFDKNIKESHVVFDSYFLEFFEAQNGKYRIKIILLVSIILSTLGILNRSLSVFIINYILTKYCNFPKDKLFSSKMNRNFHFLSAFYFIYKIVREKNNSIDSKKYDKIIENLLFNKLVMKTNYIYNEILNLEENLVINAFIPSSTILSNQKLKILGDLDVKEEVLYVIQLLNDFIYCENIESTLVVKKNKDYSDFVEFKNKLFEDIGNKNEHSNFANFFQDNRVLSVGNQNFFKKIKVENVIKYNSNLNLDKIVIKPDFKSLQINKNYNTHKFRNTFSEMNGFRNSSTEMPIFRNISTEMNGFRKTETDMQKFRITSNEFLRKRNFNFPLEEHTNNSQECIANRINSKGIKNNNMTLHTASNSISTLAQNDHPVSTTCYSTKNSQFRLSYNNKMMFPNSSKTIIKPGSNNSILLNKKKILSEPFLSKMEHTMSKTSTTMIDKQTSMPILPPRESSAKNKSQSKAKKEIFISTNTFNKVGEKHIRQKTFRYSNNESCDTQLYSVFPALTTNNTLSFPKRKVYSRPKVSIEKRRVEGKFLLDEVGLTNEEIQNYFSISAYDENKLREEYFKRKYEEQQQRKKQYNS